jgi:UPF0755 protein
MRDELGLFNDPHADHETQRMRRVNHRRRRRGGRRRITLWVSLLVVLLLIGGGVWYGLTQILNIGSYDDYAGAGENDVLVEVQDGDSTGDIASHLKEKDVVASAKAFVEAAKSDERVRAVQPGYYVMKTKVSGKDAVARIVGEESRVGNLQIRAGSQLHDITKLDGTVTPGIVSLLAKASCAELNGASTCVSVEELREVAKTADLAQLGVPDWAVPDASKAEPERRLEGLVMPDVYDVRPGSTPQELWQAVLADSSVRMQAAGMPKIADDSGFTPYQVLVMASLVEKEAITKDFAKVSRVTYNRLKESMNLEYDSTINYVLDRPAIRTKPEDRARTGPYNTYDNSSLPPTPIGSASKDAITAAVQPAEGNWLFFVRCETDGTSCFAETDDEHEANKRKAQENGAY